ncbi:hypothetical protein C8J56DRAFT_112851 [Mycena floridula]|nr:hypothetical protein C8J56DRAFT_112851 [Mycena floridula]
MVALLTTSARCLGSSGLDPVERGAASATLEDVLLPWTTFAEFWASVAQILSQVIRSYLFVLPNHPIPSIFDIIPFRCRCLQRGSGPSSRSRRDNHISSTFNVGDPIPFFIVAFSMILPGLSFLCVSGIWLNIALASILTHLSDRGCSVPTQNPHARLKREIVFR